MQQRRIPAVRKYLVMCLSIVIVGLAAVLIAGPEKVEQWATDNSLIEKSWNDQGTSAPPKEWNK